MPSMLIPHINGKGVQGPADGLASRRTVGKAGAEAKLGPESHIPFIMLYLTISIANSLISSSPHISTAPRRGGMKSGAQTPPDAKAWFAQQSCAHVVFARGALRRSTVPRI